MKATLKPEWTCNGQPYRDLLTKTQSNHWGKKLPDY